MAMMITVQVSMMMDLLVRDWISSCASATLDSRTGACTCVKRTATDSCGSVYGLADIGVGRYLHRQTPGPLLIRGRDSLV